MILGRDWKLAFCHEHLRPVLRAFRLGESGSSLIEFALSVSLLMMVVFGIMGLSLAAFSDHFVAIAAQAATRYASVRGSTWSSTCASASATGCVTTAGLVQSYVQSLAPAGINTGNLTVQTTWPGTTPAGGACFQSSGKNSPGCTVQVTVTYSFSFLLPFMPANTMNLSSTGALPIAQ